MAEEIREAGFGELEEWLTCAVPAAIVEGRERIPARPQTSEPQPTRARRRLRDLLGR